MPPPPLHKQDSLVTPVSTSIVIKLLEELHANLASAIDKYAEWYPVPAPKQPSGAAELVAAWKAFPRCAPFYVPMLKRLAGVAASVNCEQAIAELVLQWLPPSAGAGMGGSAFMRSQFDFQNFQARINCVRPSFASSDRKEQAAKQAEESRNMEVVQMVVGMVVCDVLHALLTPRPGQTACPIDADTAHATVQLAFQRFNPQERQSAVAIHPELHQALHQGMVRRWSEVLCHLSLSRFDQITGELVGRVHSVKGADDVINYLVGTQRLTILSLWGPSVGPFVDLFKQLACLHKPPFNSPLVRLCLLHNIELAVRQIDCSSPDDSSATAPIFEKLKPIAEELSGWVDGKAPEITAAATQVIALIVSRAPLPFWHAHMDVSKEGKKKGNALLGGKKEGLLRLLLTDQAYDEKISRAALCGVLRLLCGGAPLPVTILGAPTEGEWWHENAALFGEKAVAAADEKDAKGGSLMDHVMRPSDVHGGDAAAEERELVDRLRFVIEKLFQRKHGSTGRGVRLPKILDNGDVLVYVIGQIAVHSAQTALEAIELLLKDPKDVEYNLIGICGMKRVLLSPALQAIVETRGTREFVDRVFGVMTRMEHEVGAAKQGMSLEPMPFVELRDEDSVQVLLRSVGGRKDRDLAVKLAMYREAVSCIPLAMPAACLTPPSFVGQLILHSDKALAESASRVLQKLIREQPEQAPAAGPRRRSHPRPSSPPPPSPLPPPSPPQRRPILHCLGKFAFGLMAMPGGSQAPLCSAHHKQACVVMENQLLTVLHHVRHLLAIWADGMPKEHWALESAEQELGGSLVVRIEDDLVEIDTVALAALAHPSAAVRKEALAVAATTRRLYVARRQAYEMAVASKVELLQRKIASGKGGGRASQWRTSTGPDGRSRSPPKATGRGSMVANTTEALEAELAELKERQARAEPVEPFLLELIDECAVVVVRRAVKRELLDSAQGVGSELPNEAQFEKMQVPPLRKLLELPEQALFMSAQVTYTLAELVASAVACGCAKRTTKLRELLVAAIPRLPEPKKLSEFLAEGDMGTAVLWRNYHAMVFSLAAACKSTLPAPTPREPTQAAAAAAAAAAGVPPPLPLNAGDDDDDDDDAVDLERRARWRAR